MQVAIIDRSTSVRGLLRRALLAADGLEVGLVSGDLESSLRVLQGQPHDAAVVGLHPGASGRLDGVFDLIADSVVPLVLLAAPLSAGEWALATRQSLDAAVRRVVVLEKPDRPSGWQTMVDELPSLVLDLGRRANARQATLVLPDHAQWSRTIKVIAIGASAGGPAAVCATLKAIGEHLRDSCVVVVQHIGAGFVAGFVNWLARELRSVKVGVARHGEKIRPGTVRIAPAHSHLTVDHQGRFIVDADSRPRQGHRPSVEVLFESLVDWRPQEVAAVLLSGMGDDGADGLLALRRAGALTIAQDETSCSVFGMPRIAIDRGAAMMVLPPVEIGRALGLTLEQGMR